MRLGTPVQDVKDALENPIGFGDKIVMSDGDERQKYFGKRASVVISITGKKTNSSYTTERWGIK